MEVLNFNVACTMYLGKSLLRTHPERLFIVYELKVRQNKSNGSFVVTRDYHKFGYSCKEWGMCLRTHTLTSLSKSVSMADGCLKLSFQNMLDITCQLLLPL